MISLQLCAWVTLHVPYWMRNDAMRECERRILALAPIERDPLTIEAYEHEDARHYRTMLADERAHGRCLDWPVSP